VKYRRNPPECADPGFGTKIANPNPEQQTRLTHAADRDEEKKKMDSDQGGEKVSQGLMRFFDGLGPEERDELLELLRDPKTFIAEDLDDLLAVLKHLEQMRTNEEVH
jgi:hypothetical protein